MACRTRVRWYIESADGTSVLVKDKSNLYLWSPKVFELKPRLYKSVRIARQVAHLRDGIVKSYRKSDYNVKEELPF